MRKVLIIGNLWPYHQRTGARIPGLAKYLPEFGWEPVLLTTPLGTKPALNYRVIEIPYRSALDFWLKLFRFKTEASATVREQAKRRLGVKFEKSWRSSFVDFVFTRMLEVIDYPDMEKGWKAPAIRACLQMWQGEGFRAVLSSSPPVTSHLIARELKLRFGVAWIADLPHLWSQNNSYTYSSLRRMVDRRLELKTLSPADGLTTTSEPLAKKLGGLHRNKMVHAITHGFDPELVSSSPARLTKKMSITYTGSFDPVLRPPSMLLEALYNLISRNILARENVEVRFYGPEESWIDTQIDKYGLSGIVRQYGRIPMTEAQEKQRESQLLFNPKWDDPQEPGIHSLKLLEYLAARRPILATGKYPDVVDELLNETRAGTCVYSVADAEHALEKAYQEYEQTGKVAWHGDESKVNAYSQREMAGKFARILDSLT
jgi:glycosyltransferase involved in cell wall biosynthesis